MRYSALVVDWGGVLTAPLRGAMSAWAQAEGVDYTVFGEVLRQWREAALTEADGSTVQDPVAALETGQLSAAQFEVLVAEELARRGSPVHATGLLGRMLAGLAKPEPAMFDLLRRAKDAGLGVALLSNSWGNTYDRTGWDELFDAVVISGEIGMRKPEPRIYEHTVGLLDRPAHECVMIDDLVWNVEAARAVGMGAVHHRTPEQTARELEGLLGARLG